MSIDFDSAALQTQHEEEEYDREDYAREQEVVYGFQKIAFVLRNATTMLLSELYFCTCWLVHCL